MKKLACTLIISLGTLRLLGAAEELTTATPPAEEIPVFELKNKSSFTMEESSRNPFWPIGWKPAPKQAARNEGIGPEISPTSFVVSSITVDTGGKFAIINGKTMSEGQVFGLQMGGQTYQITVKAIQDGQVVLLRRDEEIAVPLRRR